jgi:hypothetical protein
VAEGRPSRAGPVDRLFAGGVVMAEKSPLEKLRDWKPTPIPTHWVVLQEGTDRRVRPLASFETREDAVGYCCDRMLDLPFGEGRGYEWAEEHWNELFSVMDVTHYPAL